MPHHRMRELSDPGFDPGIPCVRLQSLILACTKQILIFFSRIDDAGRSSCRLETDMRARSRYAGLKKTIPGGVVVDGLQRVPVPCRRDTGRTAHVYDRRSEASELR